MPWSVPPSGELLYYIIFLLFSITYKGTPRIDINFYSSPKVIEFENMQIEDDSTIFEKGPLTKLVEKQQLVGYIHKGYWQCMDTVREKQQLEKLWESNKAPWKLWD